MKGNMEKITEISKQPMVAERLHISTVYKCSQLPPLLLSFQHLLNFGYVISPILRFRDAKIRQGPFSSGEENNQSTE